MNGYWIFMCVLVVALVVGENCTGITPIQGWWIVRDKDQNIIATYLGEFSPLGMSWVNPIDNREWKSQEFRLSLEPDKQ